MYTVCVIPATVPRKAILEMRTPPFQQDTGELSLQMATLLVYVHVHNVHAYTQGLAIS